LGGPQAVLKQTVSAPAGARAPRPVAAKSGRGAAETSPLSSDSSVRFDQSSPSEISGPKSTSSVARLHNYYVNSSLRFASRIRRIRLRRVERTQVDGLLSRSPRLQPGISHPKIVLSARRAMRRQVGPSIVLSVLIVCFFAVALFQRDPPRTVWSRAGQAAGDAIVRSRPPVQPVPINPTSGPVDFTGPSGPRTGRREESSQPAGRSSLARRTSVSSATNDSKEDTQSPGALAPPVKVVSDSPRTSFGPASAPASRPPARSRAAPAGAGRADGRDMARTPRAPFTVVNSSETIEDVALRVYGTTGETDALWRANRDALPSRDSPLSTGMLLRTPRIR
jgi:hypothetical protein